MLEKLVPLALAHRKTVLLVFGLLSLAGIVSIRNLPIDAVPDITNVQVMINTHTGALDPEKIEALVTRPLEVEMTGLPALEEVRSISKYGLSQIVLVFADGTDLHWIRQQVSERLVNVRDELPENTTPQMAQSTTGLGEVLMYAAEAAPDSELSKLSETQRLTELRTIQDYVVAPQLKRISGVAEVDTNGGFKKEVHINFFPARLERVGLTAENLVTRLETLGENFGGGYIQRKGQQVIVRTVPGLDNLEQIGQVPLGLDVRGKPIQLSQVADIRVDHPLRVGAATRNGQETVLGTVLMRTGANSRQVAQDAEKVLEELKLPKGVTIVPLYTRSFLVNATIATVAKSLTEGAVLVVAILLFLLGNLRAALIVASAIPISMLIAARGMSSLGVSANLMSLGAIDFGLLVDGSVVLIENVLSRLQSTKSNSLSKREIIEKASIEVIRPVTFGLFLIMVVYLPILTLESIEGKMFRPMATTVLLALAASLFVAVFLMPVLADLFIKVKPSKHAGENEHDTYVFRWLKKVYEPILQASFRYRRYTVIGAVALLAVASLLLFQMGSNFIPQLDEADLVIGLSRDPRQGVDASVEAQKKVEKVLAAFPEAERVFSRIGTPESATDPMGVNLADTFVILKKDRSQWKHANKSDLFAEMKKSIEQLQLDQEVSATQPIEMRFNEMLEGSRADVTLRILGPELSPLVTAIDTAQKILETIPGVESVESDPLTSLRMSEILDITPDYPNLARYGLNISDVNSYLSLVMSGKEVGSFQHNSIRIPIVAHLDESLRDRQEVIESLPVGLPQGGTVSLAKIANFSINERVTTIARSWGERYAAISINLADRDVSSFVAEAQSKISEGLKLAEGYRVYWGGQFRNLTRAKLRLAIIIPLTLLLVFFILLRNIGNLSQTLLVFACIPFAAVGGIFALYSRGIALSISAAVGFIALIGIALLNAIVLINVFHQLSESASSLRTAIQAGALSRLRPVLMTALVASLGFLPMALNTGIGAEVQRPLATVVIGGILTSTLLTLLLLPSLYEWVVERAAAPRDRS